jgi:hypothetical protein
VKHDAGHGGAQGQVHHDLVGHLLQGQAEDQHGHDHQPPADPQQARQHPGYRTDTDIHRQNGSHSSSFLGSLVFLRLSQES